MEQLETRKSYEVNIDEVTPMMQNYIRTKLEYKDCIIFYRLGDFYEMFFEDALNASKVLEITLTGKSCGLTNRVPMCGVPYHAMENYLNRLVSNGYKVAIVEQMEDPQLTKNIVKREVTKVVTPGTNLNIDISNTDKNNYLMCILCTADLFGISCVDVSTGDFFVTETNNIRDLYDEIFKFMPSEIIANEVFLMSGVNVDDLKDRYHMAVYTLEDKYFNDNNAIKAIKDRFKVLDITGLGLKDFPLGTVCAGAALIYLEEMQKNELLNITNITPYRTGKYMVLDAGTRRNLELTETLREKNKLGSLFGILDKTKTAMGARTVRNYILQPLIDRDKIIERYDAICELNDDIITRDEIREYLNPIYDLERLITRISYKTANPRDIIAFKTSIGMIKPIKQILSDFKSSLLKKTFENIDDLTDLYDFIDNSINDDPPIQTRDGGIIKENFSQDVDELRKAKTEGKSWLCELEESERERTGIKTLKIKYNKVFGYYFEITNSYKDLVPEDYIRKQTLTNAERFTTSKLKELEDKIIGSEEKLNTLEYNLFVMVREKLSEEIKRVQKTAKGIATLDAICSLAFVAQKNHYCRPEINNEGIIEIKEGRHPVVEQMISSNSFVTNDTVLNNDDKRIAIITGPNMAGKSTYMRQVALITLMAQIGSFVPASYANIGICDKIFTRVGASDDLASGQSTFMVEMTEVSNILRNATKNSLIILDEIGRGTSTFDGLSIAWAVVEYINDVNLVGAKTLFATHYHELTELEGKLTSVNNYCITVKEQGDDIVFLRKIVKGGADKSYGIQVAKLAGVPDIVINRSKEILGSLLEEDIVNRAKEIDVSNEGLNKMITKSYESRDDDEINELLKLKKDILEINLNNITPIEAINTLYELKDKLS